MDFHNRTDLSGLYNIYSLMYFYNRTDEGGGAGPS